LQIKNKEASPPINNENNLKPDANKKNENKIESEVSTDSVKGSYVSGNNVSGMILNDPNGNRLPGLYIQKNGKFIRKPEGEDI